MKFLVPNYCCLQNPRLGGYRPQIPVLSVLYPQLNLLRPPTLNKIPGYATDISCDTKCTSTVLFAIFRTNLWPLTTCCNYVRKLRCTYCW